MVASLGTSRKDRKSMTLRAVIGSVLTQPMIHWKGDERAVKDNDNILVWVTELILILLTGLEHKGGGAGLSVTTHSVGAHCVRQVIFSEEGHTCMFVPLLMLLGVTYGHGEMGSMFVPSSCLWEGACESTNDWGPR